MRFVPFRRVVLGAMLMFWGIAIAQAPSMVPPTLPSPGGQGSRPGPGGGENRPRPGGSAVQPPRPARPQPPRPAPTSPPRPARPQPPRLARPPQWGRPPQVRPPYRWRASDRAWLRRYYRRNLGYINRATRPRFVAGGFFPWTYFPYITPLPPRVVSYLRPPPPEYQMGYFNGYVVVYDPATGFIANVIDLL